MTATGTHANNSDSDGTPPPPAPPSEIIKQEKSGKAPAASSASHRTSGEQKIVLNIFAVIFVGLHFLSFLASAIFNTYEAIAKLQYSPIDLKLGSFYSTMVAISVVRLAILGPVLFKRDFLLTSSNNWAKTIPLIIVLIPQIIFIGMGRLDFASFQTIFSDSQLSAIITGIIGTIVVHGLLIAGISVPHDTTLARIYQPYRFKESKESV